MPAINNLNTQFTARGPFVPVANGRQVHLATAEDHANELHIRFDADFAHSQTSEAKPYSLPTAEEDILTALNYQGLAAPRPTELAFVAIQAYYSFLDFGYDGPANSLLLTDSFCASASLYTPAANAVKHFDFFRAYTRGHALLAPGKLVITPALYDIAEKKTFTGKSITLPIHFNMAFNFQLSVLDIILPPLQNVGGNLTITPGP